MISSFFSQTGVVKNIDGLLEPSMHFPSHSFEVGQKRKSTNVSRFLRQRSARSHKYSLSILKMEVQLGKHLFILRKFHKYRSKDFLNAVNKVAKND